MVFVATRRRQRRGDAVRVGDDGDVVLRPQLIDQQADTLLEQRQLVGCGHRTRHVDQEDQVARRHTFGLDRARALADDGETQREHQGSGNRPTG